MEKISAYGKIRGLATGVGSLPFKDPGEALDLIFKYIPNAPFWPQLPKRGIREGMVEQYSEAMPGLRMTDDGLFFDSKTAEQDLEVFYERIISRDTGYFKISEAYSAGLYAFVDMLKKRSLNSVEFIKCQVTGPFTFAASIKNEQGAALLHDDILMQAMAKGLVMKAQWQIDLLRQFKKPLILFIDEPFLGAFGSAYTALTRETALSVLAEFTESLKAPDVLIGVHCCGNTDWSILTDTPSVDIINFDAFSYLDKFTLYADGIKTFLTRGGLLCWGIVPTQDLQEGITSESLYEQINGGIENLVKKGVDRSLVSQQLLLSPSCGLGTLHTGTAGQIFSTLFDLSSRIRKGSRHIC
jgi:methionine synthase II (cobalamin-independent)